MTPTDVGLFSVAVAVIGLACVLFFKSPKEMATDLAREVHKLREDHHELSREVSEITGSLESLKESLDGLRDQVTALTNVIGVFNAGRRNTRSG